MRQVARSSAVGRFVLIKADKSYYLKSVSAEGETWARDLGLLHDYLENHFPELRVSAMPCWQLSHLNIQSPPTQLLDDLISMNRNR